MRIDILTLFPEMFNGPFNVSILNRAKEKHLLTIELINIRDFSPNKHRTVDDLPFGGGAGMVMAPEAIFEALDWLKAKRGSLGRIILLSPAGKPFNQELAWALSKEEHLVLICGHYEGIDERVSEHFAADEISIGDYVLTGGELPAMVVVDAVARLLPGVLGRNTSVTEESFTGALLEYPQYTRPREYRGYSVPEVLLSGHHEQIRLWRRRQSLLRTLGRRADLLKKAPLTDEDRKILRDILNQLQELDL